MAIYKYTTDKVYKRYIPELKGVYFKSDWLTIKEGHCEIAEKYSWNGASPKIKIFGRIIGTWDGANNEAKYATLWHDAFYQYSKDLKNLKVSRLYADVNFYLDLVCRRFKFPMLYFVAVRLFGWITWGMQRKDNSNIETNFS